MSMKKEAIWSKQNAALRDPAEIYGSTFTGAGIVRGSLKFNASAGFPKLLHKLGITLIASREYEHLLIALNSPNGKDTRLSFFHLPHPSGVAIDKERNSMFVAATRNPNQIVEFKVTGTSLDRLKFKGKQEGGLLLPVRSKFYPGEYYFHDLALCGDQLYANSVGMNCIIRVNMNDPSHEPPLWWPKCIEAKGRPDTRANYIQLNSIAMGTCLEDSYFSASGAKISARRPGHANYPVDKCGVIFSGASGEVVGTGLTRPHSARLYNAQVWVANSGYGEVGYIEKGEFTPVFSFDGWTRGLCVVDDVLFVGVSRVLPRFRQYAPGIKSKKHICAIVAIDLKKRKIIGDIKFPYGNQIFAIDFIAAKICTGFPFTSLAENKNKIFSVSLV